MREIKFRAWDKHSEQMLKIINVRDGFTEVNKGEITTSQLFDELNSSGYIPMQFTGLLDKNGKEIYEGDIVKTNYNNNSFIINWEDIGAGLGVGFNFRDEREEDIEIIGNIYENPELIK